MNTAPERDHKPQAVPCEPPDVTDYEILALAGRGAFGSVWVARDLSGVLHALKVVDVARLPTPGTGDREEEALRLVRQRVADHPHLVRITHVSRRDGRLTYAMELADAAPDSPPPDRPGYRPDTLAGRLLPGQRLPAPDAIRLALELLSALEVLHAAQLVHRDVKPHNVIFVNGMPKLADVGLTALARTSLSVAGTPGYLPLDGSTGPDADLYALGKLLYQSVTGLEPADFPTIPARLLTGPEARLLRRLNPVLLRACASARGDRFRHAGQLRDALRGVLFPRPLLTPLRGAVCVTALFTLSLGAWLLAGHRHSPTPAAQGEPVSPATEAAKPDAPASAEAVLATLSDAPVDEDFIRLVKALPAQDQARVVAEKMKKRNPDLGGQIRMTLRAGKVVAVLVSPHHVSDISPLRALPDLVSLDCSSPTEDQRGRIADLTQLRGMKLTHLRFASNKVADLSPLQGMPLEMLDCSANAVESLEPLRGLPLKTLLCHINKVTDLSPLAELSLATLNCGANPVEDWTPLTRLPLRELFVNYSSFADFSVLKNARLEFVRCEKSRVTDLAPLARMPLVYLDCGSCKVTSLEPLRKTPLRFLGVRNTPVSDLSPLAGLRLEEVGLTGSKARDLTPLKGMPVRVIDLDFDAGRDGTVLRTFAPLRLINRRPKAELLP